MKTEVVVIVIIAIAVIFILVRSRRSNFVFTNADYQYSGPTLKNEDEYYSCILQECNGNTHDFWCLEKCHLKSFRGKMALKNGVSYQDIQSRVCEPYLSDEDAYYKCLDTVYGDYRELGAN